MCPRWRAAAIKSAVSACSASRRQTANGSRPAAVASSSSVRFHGVRSLAASRRGAHGLSHVLLWDAGRSWVQISRTP
jgi:hypothetical protein